MGSHLILFSNNSFITEKVLKYHKVEGNMAGVYLISFKRSIR